MDSVVDSVYHQLWDRLSKHNKYPFEIRVRVQVINELWSQVQSPFRDQVIGQIVEAEEDQ